MTVTTRHGKRSRALLDWYRAMGVDAALAATPIDWLARGDARRAPASRCGPRAPADAGGA